jgi:hypothetical protein
VTTPLPWPPVVPRTPQAIAAHRRLSELPPGLGSVALAGLMRCAQSRAWQWAKTFGYVTQAELRRKQWAAVDWARPDVEIARELGVTKQAVGSKRRSMGKLHLLPGRKTETTR